MSKTKKLTVSKESAKKLGDLSEHFEGRLTRSEITEEVIEFFHAGIIRNKKKILR
jgi:hypothetical protein